MAHKFKIVARKDDQFGVQFLFNSEIMVWSESFTSKSSAQNCIDSIKRNAPGAPIVDLTKDGDGSGYRWEIVGSTNGEFFNRFVASNGETMVRSETYTDKRNAIGCAESVSKNSPSAVTEDETIFQEILSLEDAQRAAESTLSTNLGSRIEREKRAEIRRELASLKQALDDQAYAGIGHNQPPSELDIRGKFDELRRDIDKLDRELSKPTPDLRRYIYVSKKIYNILKWGAKKLDLTIDSFLKKLGELSAYIAFASVIGAFVTGQHVVWIHLNRIVELSIEWLKTVL